jgi:hypothetical protein
MAKKVKKQFDSNPFLEDLLKVSGEIVPIKKKIKHLAVAVTEDGGLHSVKEDTGDIKYFFKDFGVFTKMFKGFKFSELSTEGIRMLEYIADKLKPNSDYIFVSYADYVTFSNSKSRNAYYRAIDDLVDKKIIALSMSANMFYVNPMKVFNGNRSVALDKIYSAQDEYKNQKKYLSLKIEKHGYLPIETD